MKSTSHSISTAQPAGNLLIVDADTMMCELLNFKFEKDGFRCHSVHSGNEALRLDLTKYSLVLVDLMDQQFNGLELIRSVRRNRETFNIPMIIVSATASEDDVVNGLDAGADDYVAKPFSSRELIARVRSVIRRRRMMTARRSSSEIRFESLVIDLGDSSVSLNDEQVSLTRTEFLILTLLLRNRNVYYSRSDIRHEAWDDDSVSDRAVDTNVSRLRKKLGSYGRHIVNRQGVGYAFKE